MYTPLLNAESDRLVYGPQKSSHQRRRERDVCMYRIQSMNKGSKDQLGEVEHACKFKASLNYIARPCLKKFFLKVKYGSSQPQNSKWEYLQHLLLLTFQ